MPNNGAEPRLSVAFTTIVNLGWTAGAHYYTNLFVALRHLDDDRRPRIVVIAPGPRRAGGYETYSDLADDVVERPAERRRGGLVGQVQRVRRRLGTDRHPGRATERALREHGVDAVFAAWQEYGPAFAIPLLGWIPDFQHVHHPQLFSAEENRHRDQLFGRMSANCSRIVLSSEDARHDYERFAPAYVAKARVLRFVAHVPAELYDNDPGRVRDEYHLPERFVYLPNQFWAHKNHELVVDALAVLQTRRPEITVVCTGNPSDDRDPLHFAKLLERVSRLGVRDRFVVLGWVPHAHIYSLMRQSVAVLQPSLFEGWSTTVEEAKSIGKVIALSDIPVHREQAPPGARYFDPKDPAALAACLEELYDTQAPGPDPALEHAAREALPGRTRAYAETFVEILRDMAPGADVR